MAAISVGQKHALHLVNFEFQKLRLGMSTVTERAVRYILVIMHIFCLLLNEDVSNTSESKEKHISCVVTRRTWSWRTTGRCTPVLKPVLKTALCSKLSTTRKRGLFGPGDYGKVLGGDTTLVDFRGSSYNFMRKSAPQQVIAVADDSEHSADSGDEGDDNPTGGDLESQTQSAMDAGQKLEKKRQKVMERDGVTYAQAVTFLKEKANRKAARALTRAARKAAKKETTPAKGDQGAKTSTPKSSKPKPG